MRCFIAIDMPLQIKDELRKLQQEIRHSRFTPVSDFHLTLKFLGETSGSQVNELNEKLATVEFRKFTIELDSPGVFPSESNIRIIWLGLKPGKQVCELQQKIEQALGTAPDKTFVPHLTLARVKSIDNKKAFIDAIKRINPKKLGFEVSCFKLIKSTLTPQGPIYENLAVFKFICP